MTDITIDHVLAWPLEKIESWFESQPPADFNYELLAFNARSNALRDNGLSADERIKYAKVAVLAYGRLRADRGRADFSGFDTTESEISLRTELLLRLDLEADHAFGHDGLGERLEQAVAESDAPDHHAWLEAPRSLTETPLATVRALRSVKNLLRSAERGVEGGKLTLGPRSAWWWEQRSKLP